MNDKQMLATFSLVSLVTMGIGLYNSYKRGREPSQKDSLKQQEENISKELQKMNNLQTLLATKAEEIEVKYVKNMPHILTPDCLKEILEFTVRIVDREELEIIFNNNRKARRTCFKTMKEGFPSGQRLTTALETYYRFVCTFEEQIQYLIEKSQKDFVVFLNLDYSVITDSIDFHTSEEEGDFTEWVRSWSHHIKEQLREQLPLYQKPVSVFKIMEIAEHQIQMLISEGEYLKIAILDLNLQTEDETEAIPTFLECVLEDSVYQKFSVEIEQTNLASEELTAQLKQKFHVLSELKNSVLEGMMDEEEILNLSEKSYNGDDI